MELVNIMRHSADIRVDGYPPIFLPGIGDDAPQLPYEQLGHRTEDIGDVVCPVTIARLIYSTELPEPKDDVLLIAGQLICEAFPERRDLTFPYPVETDENGRVIYACGLGQVPAPESE
ncbi:MAG: hypothetical protein LKI24_11030 [Acidipropionibacterium sp.]|jgi:hypothetical protein|nr:hypothetical protein [Acidipropionibacterium sp.]